MSKTPKLPKKTHDILSLVKAVNPVRASSDELDRMHALVGLLEKNKSPPESLPQTEENAIGAPDLRDQKSKESRAVRPQKNRRTNFPESPKK